jgi:hypothetical protein
MRNWFDVDDDSMRSWNASTSQHIIKADDGTYWLTLCSGHKFQVIDDVTRGYRRRRIEQFRGQTRARQTRYRRAHPDKVNARGIGIDKAKRRRPGVRLRKGKEESKVINPGKKDPALWPGLSCC